MVNKLTYLHKTSKVTTHSDPGNSARWDPHASCNNMTFESPSNNPDICLYDETVMESPDSLRSCVFSERFLDCLLS